MGEGAYRILGEGRTNPYGKEKLWGTLSVTHVRNVGPFGRDGSGRRSLFGPLIRGQRARLER